MLEDNPFYNSNSVENTETNNLPETENTSNEMSVEFIENTDNSSTSETEVSNTEELSRENVQEPEKKETKSTGVSTYTEVPNINAEKINCNTNMISGIDKFNLWLVFAFCIWALISFKKKKFSKLMEKITNYISKYTGVINLIFIIITSVIFLYPTFLGTGISGKLNLFTMTEFATIISINAVVFTFISFCWLRNKKILFKKPKTFSGINFLEKSLITFYLTGLLFFFFTESQIALSLLYFFVILTSLFFFIEKDDEELSIYRKLSLIIQSIQLCILASLSGFFIIMLTGALLTAYYYVNIDPKQILINLKKLKDE